MAGFCRAMLNEVRCTGMAGHTDLHHWPMGDAQSQWTANVAAQAAAMAEAALAPAPRVNGDGLMLEAHLQAEAERLEVLRVTLPPGFAAWLPDANTPLRPDSHMERNPPPPPPPDPHTWDRYCRLPAFNEMACVSCGAAETSIAAKDRWPCEPKPNWRTQQEWAVSLKMASLVARRPMFPKVPDPHINLWSPRALVGGSWRLR